MVGATALYSSGKTGTLSVTGGMLTFTGTVSAPTPAVPNPYNGFEVYVAGPSCVSANLYYGLKFKYMSSGPCLVTMAIVDTEHVTPGNDPNRGGCVATNCYPAQFSPAQFDNGSGTIKFAFSGGIPATSGMPYDTIDQGRFIGVEWQLEPTTSDATTSCTGTITVDDISLY